MTTDETESHQDKPIKQEEVSHDVRPPSPEKEKERPGHRSSSGRGLSRLFSSFLNSRSQGDTDAGEKPEKGEEGAKAPIADPEPELKQEGDVARDQASVSGVGGGVGRDDTQSLPGDVGLRSHCKP